jgi:hypothetical protein
MPGAKKESIEGQFGEMPEIKKNEVIQGADFYKAIRKYEAKESFSPWLILLTIAAIIIALIFIF